MGRVEETMARLRSVSDDAPRPERLSDAIVRRIGVVTDTHVGDELERLPPEVGRRLAGVDLILHAGDLCEPGVLSELREIAPVVAVQGNHDSPASGLPLGTVIDLNGTRIGLIHGTRPGTIEALSAASWLALGHLPLTSHLRALRRRLGAPVDLIVTGHLHLPLRRVIDGTLFFSPGSVYQPELDPSFAWDGRMRRIYARLRGRLPASWKRPAVGIIEVGIAGLATHAIPLTEPIHPGGPPPPASARPARAIDDLV